MKISVWVEFTIESQHYPFWTRRLKKQSTRRSVEIGVSNLFSLTDQHFASNLAPNDPTDQSMNDAIQPVENRKLADLLSKAQVIINELDSVRLQIVEQPKLFWHSRYLTCLLNGTCSGLTGRSGKQDRFIVFRVESSNFPRLSEMPCFSG